MFSQGTRDTLIKGAIVTGGAVFILNKVSKMLFGGPGATTRVPFNLHDTQVRRMYTNSPNQGDYVEVPDPWSPEQIAAELHTAMSGIHYLEYGVTDRSEVWRLLSMLGIERLKYLHNYWLDKVDPVDTIYRWINGERVLRWSEEHDRREQAKQMLRRAGIGF